MPQDFPLSEIAPAMHKWIKEGWTVHQKFTCEKCGERCIIQEANKLYNTGECCKCGATTDIRKTGCNYLKMMAI